MNELAPLGQRIISTDQIQRITALYEDGLYSQAYRQAVELGPLQLWRGTDARILAGRLAGNLGAPRMGDWHFLSAWRRDKSHAEAMWYYGRTLLTLRGPLAAWRFVQSHSFPANASTQLQSHWLAQRGAILGVLRDFDAAEDWLRKADDLGPHAWTCLEWAALYSLEDRHEEAEAAARRSLEIRPWYRPAVQWVAHFLVQKERDAEAIELLTQAAQKLECGAIHAQLAVLQIELKRFDDALHNLAEYERLSPLLEFPLRQWLAARRCDMACFRGRYDEARSFARAVAEPNHAGQLPSAAERKRMERWKKSAGKFYGRLMDRLGEGKEPGKRVEIPVGFVRQHHHTCAPATLTSIAKFWSMPAEHVEVADEISYLGTTAHNERKWAKEHGWYTKAFTVTWAAAVALIDRGIPFSLTTVDVSSAHAQAVIGYDSTRGTLILRDPGERHRLELPFDEVQERYRATGPRGLALVPLAHREKLEALALPDEALYEHVQRFDLALEGHRRSEAGEAAQTLAKEAPGHYLTLYAMRALANYDADPPAGLLATDQLLKLFPGDLFLELARADYLRTLGKREQRLDLLRQLSERKETDPACWQFYAEELAGDARRDSETLYHLRKAIRATPAQAPLQGRLLDLLARIRMDQRKYEEAMQMHHFACCLEEKDEYIANNFFLAARARGEAEQAISLLRRRFKRFGGKSSQPARTLYNALIQTERYAEAFDVLNEAMRLRPKDGDLLTYAADAHTYRAEFDEAERILEQADGVSKPAVRLRSLAFLELNRDQRSRARDYYEAILKIEPLAEDAHRSYLQLLAEKEERSAAVKHLETVCRQFPNHFGLTRLWYDWLLEDGPVAREPIVKKLVEIHPTNWWARIEYAYNLAEQDRIDEAHRQLDEAEPLNPEGPEVWYARGLLHKKRFRTDDALFAFREAIRHGVDFEPAIHELIWQSENLQIRRDSVAFVLGELLRQSTLGNGILALAWVAQPVFPPEELLSGLRRIHEARPELWQGWTVVTRQLGYLERDGESLTHGQKAVQRFPANAELWLDLADAHRAQEDTEKELQALQRAVELLPSGERGLRMLAEAYERAGAKDDAKKVFEQAIRRMPLVAGIRIEYATLLYRLGERDAAIQQGKQALQLDPWLENSSRESGWSRLCVWLMQLDRMDEGVELAREWTKKRPGDPRSWLRLGQALQWLSPRVNSDEETERVDGSAAAYDEALKRSPAARDFCDLKAEMLGLAGRFDAAAKACRPLAYKKQPLELRGRAAWVTAMEGDYDSAKQQMVAILKEDRTYQWGWDRLVEWSMATHQYREYHDAANEAFRNRSQSATFQAYRGEARVRMDDREAGLDDLRNAHRKDPCNALAAFLLFDEQMTDDNLAGAEATLLTMQQSVVGDFVRARQVQFHGKRENQSIALALFKRLCTSAFTQPQALDMAMRALDMAGWKKEAEEVLRDAMQKPNWNTHLALMFAAHWNPTLANDLPDRIAVLDRALERQPETFRFLDLKAELLANGNQFERAWQVCKEKTLPQDQFALDGRAAWVMYRSGRINEAIAAMRDLVKRYPKYYWGWSQLADWYGRAQNWVDVLTVAEQLVVLAPRDPIGYGYRGQAKQFLNDPQAARADYLHALDLQPAYMFAAWALFELYVRNSEWARAEKILEKSKKHADKGEWALRKVDLLVYQNRKSTFPTEFENLCRNSEKNPMLVHHSLMLLVQAGWWSDAEEVLHRCLDLGAHICDRWVGLRVSMGDRKVASDIENMSTRRPERTNCIAAYAIELAYAKDPRGLRSWIDAHEEELRADTPCWAKVGQALAVVEDWHGVAEWMFDWSKHPRATPWMLLALVKALRSIGEKDEARKVGLFALTKLNPDYANSFHKVWLMLDQALEGDVIPVQRYLESADLGGFDGYHQMVAAMVRAIWLTTTDKEAGFSKARRVLADAAQFALPTIHDPALTKSYQRTVAAMAEIRGTFWAKLWRIWRWLSPKLPPAQKNG